MFLKKGTQVNVIFFTDSVFDFLSLNADKFEGS